MSRKPDLHTDHRILTIVHWTMVAIAGLLAWTIVPMLSGGPIDTATPIGLCTLVATVGIMWWTGHKLTDKEDGGPRLAYWGRAIRTMGTINIIVSLILIALPRIP
jgi:hypothetical protein